MRIPFIPLLLLSSYLGAEMPLYHAQLGCVHLSASKSHDSTIGEGDCISLIQVPSEIVESQELSRGTNSHNLTARGIDSFLSQFPGPIYQDVVMGQEIYPIGTDLCESRYDLIRPILNLYDHPFSLFDLGAAQGYFSFRIARDYPHSTCVMAEANDTSYYSRHGDMLYDLCLKNRDLNNIFYLNKRMDLSDLFFLNQREHFDIVVAFLVVHLMHEKLQDQIKIIDSLLTLGDNLILEVANDVGVIHTAYVEYLSQSLGGQYLGEVKRHKNPDSQSTGKLFWFKQNRSSPFRGELQPETFTHLNGVYPIQ
jgi:hypothetical protein